MKNKIITLEDGKEYFVIEEDRYNDGVYILLNDYESETKDIDIENMYMKKVSIKNGELSIIDIEEELTGILAERFIKKFQK